LLFKTTASESHSGLFIRDQGYGIRILDSYINALEKYKDAKNDPSLALDATASTARDWTEMIIDRYLQFGHQDRLSYIKPYTRSRTPATSTTPIFSHALLETRAQKDD
jgi:hypothetical protein